MRTILVIFTKEKQITPKGREYTYNTESDVKVGDLIHIEDSRGNQQVTKIHSVLYKHYRNDGSLFVENDDSEKIDGDIKEVICTKIQ